MCDLLFRYRVEHFVILEHKGYISMGMAMGLMRSLSANSIYTKKQVSDLWNQVYAESDLEKSSVDFML